MGIENPVHLLFIALVALVVLGPKRLPALARALGKGVREFREAIGQGESQAEPSEPSEPAELAKPTKPTEPREPTEPTHSVDPLEPVRSPDAPDRGPL